MYSKVIDWFSAAKNKEAKETILIVLVIFLVTFTCFSNSLSGEFIYDDYIVLVEHPSIKSLSNIPRIFFEQYFAIDNSAGLYRPLTIFSFCINFAVSKLDPYGYHLVNIFIHAINSILIYWISERYTKIKSLSLLCALLFSAHPVHSEAVAAIYGRPELMATMFLLIAWCFFIKSSQNNFWYVLSLISYFLSLLCKESGIVFVGILLLVHICQETSWTTRLKPSPKLLGYILATIPYLILRVAVTKVLGIPKGGQILGNEPFLTRVFTMSYGYFKYFVLLIWPAKLYTDYDFSVIPKLTNLNLQVVCYLILIFSLVLIGIWQINKNPLVAFSILFFFVTTSIVSNIIFPTGILIAERTIYLPVVSVCLLLASGLTYFYQLGWKNVILGVSLVILLGEGTRTYYRNQDFQSDFTLFSSILKLVPEHPRATYAMGLYYEHIGQLDKAEDYFKKAIALSPNSSFVNTIVGNFYNKQRRADLAMQFFKRAIELDPNNAEAHSYYGAVLLAQGNLCDAKSHLTKAISISNSLVKAHNNLAIVYAQMNLYSESEAEFKKAISIDPSYVEALENLKILEEKKQSNLPPVNCPN
jgi:tetratricopeptide (TPR) repeat protein